MTCSHLKIASDKVLILDTSTVIYLHKSEFGETIYRILPNLIVITNAVFSELNHPANSKFENQKFLAELFQSERVTIATLNGTEKSYLKQLVAKNIDIGEASVISVAKFRYEADGCIPIIDDKKGNSLAKFELQKYEIGTTFDLLRHPSVVSELGRSKASDALYNALRFGQMGVLDQNFEDVIDIIGEDRARNCRSLPGYKQRYGNRKHLK